MKAARIAALFCLLVGVQTSPAETIRITTGEYTPWTSENLKHGGFTNHIISEAFKIEGHKVKFTFFPWKRAYESAKDGKMFQATSYWYPSEKRARDFYYSEALQNDQTVFFHLKDKPLPDWATLDDFKGKRIGATREYTYTQEFWDAQESGRLNIQVANSDEVNFNKLIKGRIDMFPAENVVGQNLLQDVFGSKVADRVTFHPKPLVAPSGHLLFSKQLANGEELVATFNQGLAKLKQSGRYAQFRENLIAGKYRAQPSPIPAGGRK